MASKPNPSWSEPQKKVFKQIQDATEIVIPYFGEEIPRLDNHTNEMLCDELGAVKQAKKAIEKVEKTLGERFKPRMKEKELRGTRFVAEKRTSERTALNQGQVKAMLAEFDECEVSLARLLVAIKTKALSIPNELFLTEDEKLNCDFYFSSTPVEALYVEPIA